MTMPITCRKCGAGCCKTMLFDFSRADEDEIEAMLTRSVGYEGGRFMISVPCKHLGGDDRCKIYERRPKLCREYAVRGRLCKLTRRILKRIADPVSAGSGDNAAPGSGGEHAPA